MNQQAQNAISTCKTSSTSDNKANTFVNSLGQESSEIDYFLHNLTDGEFQRKQVLHDMPENKSDHYPTRMSIKFKHQNVEVHRKQNNSRIARKINWDKVDKKWYSAHICTHIDNLQINENMEETAIEQAILKLCELLKETATSPHQQRQHLMPNRN